MTEGLLEKLVDQDFGITGRGKWYHSDEHDSLVVNAENQTWFWNSRGIRGGLLDYLIEVRGMEKSQAREFLNNYIGGLRENSGKLNKSQPYERLIDLMWSNGLKQREYWYTRKLNDDTIDRYKLGYYDNWFLVPVYKNGEFVNFQCRRDLPEKSMMWWYRHGEVYLFNEAILPFTKRIYITEGLIDAILLNQEGFPSVSGCGANTWKDDWYYKFSHIPEIYYFEDNDKAGRLGARLIAKSLGLNRVRIVSFTDKKEKYDTGDFFKEGGTKEDLKEHIKSNSHYLFELENINETLRRFRH